MKFDYVPTLTRKRWWIGLVKSVNGPMTIGQVVGEQTCRFTRCWE